MEKKLEEKDLECIELLQKNDEYTLQLRKRDGENQIVTKRFMSPDNSVLKKSGLSGSGVSVPRMTHLEQMKESNLNKKNQ